MSWGYGPEFPGDTGESREAMLERIADISCDVAPDLTRAVARLTAWCHGQHGAAPDPGIYYADVRAVLAARGMRNVEQPDG